jgi:flagellar L-ring protein precursor FlgH
MRIDYRSMLTMALLACLSLNAAAKPRKEPDALKLRNEYVARVQQQTALPEAPQNGSLWTPGAALQDMSGDYKASRLNDTIRILVSATTTAKSSGDVSQDRSLTANSAITGLAGHVSTGGVNPIINASSSHKLKGAGSSNSASQLSTSLAGQVIAVLPNGNLVVEAERKIVMNNQKETMVVRGVARPGDISSANSIASSSLMNLEVELKGKGVVSDATRSPNPLIRALLWAVSF